MADVTYIPEGNSQGNNILPWMLASQNGGFGGFGGGWGGGILGFFLGLLFGNGWGGFGGFGNGFGGGAGAGFLSNQLNNDNGRDLLMQAITSQGEAPAYIAGDSARELAEVVCKLGCDHCSKLRVH